MTLKINPPIIDPFVHTKDEQAPTGETVRVYFPGPRMESAADYLSRLDPRDRLFAALNRAGAKE